MDLHYAGLGVKQAGIQTVSNGARNVNGTSHKGRSMLRLYKRVGRAACQARKFYVIFTHGRSMSGPVKVQIFGQTYSIQGDLDVKYVQKLAQYVDEKMHTIADATATVDTQKVAVLAALAIADELHSLQRDRGDHEQLMREQAERCLTLVERALKQTA
jgi:cell division protein ZapA